MEAKSNPLLALNTHATATTGGATGTVTIGLLFTWLLDPRNLLGLLHRDPLTIASLVGILLVLAISGGLAYLGRPQTVKASPAPNQSDTAAILESCKSQKEPPK